jgi:hypothetical protein
MSGAVQRLIDAFESLSDEEKRQAVAELLHRAPYDALSDDDLLQAADELFRNLDTDEAETNP